MEIDHSWTFLKSEDAFGKFLDFSKIGFVGKFLHHQMISVLSNYKTEKFTIQIKMFICGKNQESGTTLSLITKDELTQPAIGFLR